jgi:hypothetical protein
MVLPPRGSDHKVGLFSTRSPYRPNQIGMSAVQLEKIDGLNIYIQNHDILDGTPVLDIKPYLPYSDSFPDAKIGWLDNIEKNKYVISFFLEASIQLQFLFENNVTEIKAFIIQQLEFEPTNSKKKRVEIINQKFVLAYRTWRIVFNIQGNSVEILRLQSGYSSDDLDEGISNYTDPYSDKQLHRNFSKKFMI